MVKDKLGEEGFKPYSKISSELKEYEKAHREKLKYIRVNLIAHRNSNGKEMAEGMLSVDPKEVFDIGKYLFSRYLELLGMHIELIDKL